MITNSCLIFAIYLQIFWVLKLFLQHYIRVSRYVITKNTRRVLKIIKIFSFGFSTNRVIIYDKKRFMCLCWRIGISPRFIPRKSDSHEGFDNNEMIKKLMIYPIVQKLMKWIHFLHVFLWNPSNFIHFATITKTDMPNSCI